MLRTRQIAKDLNLDMKIGDVEYQGDGNKAIFYYIADQRVDFRELIKVLADTFHVRIEMKQIGARQEAGRIGGTGPCGRELCCSTFMTNFRSVGTNAARVQDLSMNPQKLAGQCAKLKCCLNYEFDNYVEALKEFPSKDIVLETAKGPYYFFKLDVFARKMTYSADKKAPVDLLEMPLDEVWKIINENKKGKKVSEIQTSESKNEPEISFENAVGEGSLTRFDKNKKKKKHKHRPNNQKPSDSGAENK